jgi:uncharacterized protein YciI
MRPVWLCVTLYLLSASSDAAQPAAAAPSTSATPAYDAALAGRVGADADGMRAFVFVLLKTGPTRVPDGAERDAMFKGHFDNINRLAAAGKLVLAGPFDGAEGWRGMFVFASEDIDEVKALVATDPVIQKGEMVAEYHKYFGSAALMLINELHAQIDRP